MARARNIKPSFFTDDELAEIDPLGRLFFIGLWTVADYKGCVEWRPKRLKAQLLPYDDCDLKEIAINLDKSGFIRFYSNGDKIYIKVLNFEVHQNPHKNEREKGSDIPEYTLEMRQVIDLTTLTINLDKSRLNHDENETNPADSPFLIPDSLYSESEKKSEEKPAKKSSNKFKPPSIDEIFKHCGDREESEKFFNFYTSKNWMVGKNKMASWRHALGNWMSRNKPAQTQERKVIGI